MQAMKPIVGVSISWLVAGVLLACGGGSSDTDFNDSPNTTGAGGSSSGNSATNGNSTSGNASSTSSSSGTNSSTNGNGSGGSASNTTAASTTVDPIPPVVESGSCGLETPAFCETFDDPHPGGRGADINEERWSFSRYGHPATMSFFLRGPLNTRNDQTFPASLCGEPFSGLLPGDDVVICEGMGVSGSPSNQLSEVMDDEGDFGFNSMRIRQPFDFANRTGTIVWDVDAKSNPLSMGHGWWIEVWITEDPLPMPYHEAPTVVSFPRSGVGFAFQFGAACPNSESNWSNSLETVTVTKDYEILHSIPFWEFATDQGDPDRCFAAADTKLNHMELRISQDRAELWASDYEDPASFRRRAVVQGLDVPFSKGYVHFQHAAYNAPKDGNVTGAQTFRWDNIGFDGPTYPTPRGYDVPDNDEMESGKMHTAYHLADGQTQSFTLEDVDLSDAVRATFNFNIFATADQTLEFRFNGGDWHSQQVIAAQGHEGTALRTFSTEAPLEELVDGKNTIDVRMADLNSFEMIGNIDLTIEATE